MDQTTDETIEDRFDAYLADLTELVAQPSISATGEGIRECARHERDLCLEYGFDEAEIVETSGHPSVLARAYVGNDPDNDAPTALVYGHYDVQPVDPEQWTSPPFEPEIRVEDGEELLYGRGTVDNKGQHFTYPCAVRTLRDTTGLPCNVTLILDGEEESGSPNLFDAVEAREADLAADVSINSDGPVDGSGRPSVSFGNRGILVVGLDVSGPESDLHSGHYGGAVPSPAWELIRLLGTMRDEHGRIAVDGFYDEVAGVPEPDRDLLDEFEPDPDQLQADLEIGGFQNGPGETFLEKTLYYPSLNVNGLASGHGEAGFKTIVPSDASATIDVRLVVDQDPDRIFELFEQHVEDHADDRLGTTVTYHASMDPMRTPIDTPYFDPIVDAVTDGWGEEPVVKPSTGGSAPYALFTDYLGLPHASIPYGQNDNNQHSPDERFAVEHFRKGIRTSARLLDAVSTV
ncbi:MULTISPECIES: M20/M25/M40 family metallo-hydrolase [Halolamina]|uniref:Acetylornithine deacetylase/Succinyl-diaminopimelate desuccinylase n=1 Tax=Halolamina pelagica TaxID=699431 RepID=A0A1I5NP27_9EURY|nr:MULTISPECIES: M20/M25/M40 family metallo-hydrolase [Halolamina]NHX36412.1 M20 family dipeptidase [Halolamina sp. R1-12]SFP23588.1 Acetylornithine deacetylase/Succinyl-diaminopimelate desuccinylase [Halolamina pelagica]